jgi:hypothetical protein
LFVTHSSDLLHLQVSECRLGGVAYQCLLAKSAFSKYDILAEVRGSIISYERLRRVVAEGRVDCQRLPTLLYLNHEQQLLISPKNITKYLFTRPRSPTPLEHPPPNSYLENHFGSKLLVIASRDIAAGEELLLEQQSQSNAVYRFDPCEF